MKKGMGRGRRKSCCHLRQPLLISEQKGVLTNEEKIRPQLLYLFVRGACDDFVYDFYDYTNAECVPHVSV